MKHTPLTEVVCFFVAIFRLVGICKGLVGILDSLVGIIDTLVGILNSLVGISIF